MTSGIYAIKHIESGKIYIGQAVIISRRWKDHQHKLRCNKHHNSYLQHAWNKYGEESFVFEILEKCPVEVLTEKELAWVTKHTKDMLYNIGAIEAPMLGMKHTEEALQKMRQPKSEEHRLKISNALKGKKHSETHSRNTGVSKKRPVQSVTTGVSYPSITEAAAHLGVHRFTLGRHLSGKSKHCQNQIFIYLPKIK